MRLRQTRNRRCLCASITWRLLLACRVLPAPKNGRTGSIFIHTQPSLTTTSGQLARLLSAPAQDRHIYGTRPALPPKERVGALPFSAAAGRAGLRPPSTPPKHAGAWLANRRHASMRALKTCFICLFRRSRICDALSRSPLPDDGVGYHTDQHSRQGGPCARYPYSPEHEPLPPHPSAAHARNDPHAPVAA
jgi:hypothetical protein